MYANKSFFLLQKNEIKTLCTLEDYEIKIMKLLFPIANGMATTLFS
jgi:hypothetical protein